jgi:hypothetical protein
MNKITKIAVTTLLSSISLMLVGCSGTPVHIQTTSPKLYESVKDKGKTISASASGFQLLLFIPIDINDRQKRAYQLLEAQAGGGYITNVKIKEEWTYALVGTSYKTTMTATVYPKN